LGSRLGFAALSAIGFFLAACGRQVTPNPPGLGGGGAPPGYMAVFFDTQAAFNFSNYQYMLVFNTTGSRVTPSTDTIQTNWAGWSYGLTALGNGMATFAEPVRYVRSNQNPHVPPYPQRLGSTPQQFSYNLNANGSGTEFSILAQKRIFFVTPGPSSTAPPTPSNVWTFNAFVTQAIQGNWTFVDSMGAGGPTDPQYVSPTLCMTEPFDNTYYPQGQYAAPDPAAQIVSIEIANNPVSPSPCP
jgi:hypothetical protein